MKGWFASFAALAAAASLVASCSPSSGGDDDDDLASITPTPTPSPLPNNGSLSFDGVDDYVRIDESAELNDLTGLTVEAWVKPAAGATGLRSATGKTSSGTRQSWALVRGTNGALSATVGGLVQECAAISPAPLPEGVWTHVALTWSDADPSPSLYVGGALQATTPCDTAIAWVLAPTAIGAVFQDDGLVVAQNWSGLVDEVRIWKTKRSAAQIAAEMGRSLNATPASDLVASFRFEEGAGDAATGGPTVPTGRLGSATGADTADPAWSTDTPF